MQRLAATSLTALALASIAGSATAQTAPARPAAPATAGSDDNATIVVTGTRRTDRSITDSASPIDVVTATDIRTQPAANLLDVVRNLVPSFFVGQNTISDASTFVRAPSLRGLGADQILVQLNGKRYNRSALVQVYGGGDTALSFGSQGADISAIPALALGNLQILRDGATAQYGSDAIAGVLNYGLREDAGLEMVARYGQTYEGDGRSYQIAANAGIKLSDRGFINVTGEYSDEGGTSRGATRPQAVIFAQQNPNLANQLPNFPGPAQIWGSSPSHGYKFVLNSAYELTPEAKIYFIGNLAHSKADQSFNYRPPNAVTGLQTSNGLVNRSANAAFSTPVYLTKCPAGNVTCPASGFVKDANIYNFTTLYPAGFTPRFVGEVDQKYGVLGLKGALDSGFTYDISGTLARNSLKLSMYNSLSSSFGAASQTSFEFGKLIQEEMNFNLDLTYPVDLGLASPVTLSGGSEFRQETYSQTAGDLQSYAAGFAAVQNLYTQTSPGVFTPAGQVTKPPGASGYGGTSPQAAGSYRQKSYAIYAGAETDITKTLSVGAMGRFEHYNTFGSAFVVKGNAIWHATDTLALRATAGTGFHAPSPGQNNVQILTTTFVNGDQVQAGTYPVTSPIAQFYGAKSLSPERSTNFGAGFVFTPQSALTLTVDGYYIKVRNRIGVSQNFTVTAADLAKQPALSAVGLGGAVNYFTNAFDTKTRGVDVVGTWRGDLANGNLNLTLAYNYNLSTVPRFNAAIISAGQIVNIRNLAPNHRANFSANWQLNDFAVTVRESFFGSWRNEVDYPGQQFGSKFTTDIDLSYTIAEHYTLSVGAINLFDARPDKIAASTVNPIYALTGALNDGSIYPRNGGPFGINGGFWYARVRVKF
ncbi:MAG: TonB-dependent receptor [Sandarakinorhabdus sp.]|nr:TonB-dependent receptor [Sandarakinorhabdus sp.]